MTRQEWLDMARMMGVANMGGPAVNFLTGFPTPTVARGATAEEAMKAMDHGKAPEQGKAMDHANMPGMAAPAHDTTHAAMPAMPGMPAPSAAPVPSTATKPAARRSAKKKPAAKKPATKKPSRPPAKPMPGMDHSDMPGMKH
jgi:hypothetical protein